MFQLSCCDRKLRNVTIKKKSFATQTRDYKREPDCLTQGSMGHFDLICAPVFISFKRKAPPLGVSKFANKYLIAQEQRVFDA